MTPGLPGVMGAEQFDRRIKIIENLREVVESGSEFTDRFSCAFRAFVHGDRIHFDLMKNKQIQRDRTSWSGRDAAGTIHKSTASGMILERIVLMNTHIHKHEK